MLRMTTNFTTFFGAAEARHTPRPFQVALAENDWPETLVIPTGFGKTDAVLAAWLWKVGTNDKSTPRRLVYCLPMRTLVEQTEGVARSWCCVAKEFFGMDVDIHVMMGGRLDSKRGLPNWILYPERPAILIGTQDLLVSAALMRGYGVTRYRWPVDFALLHNGAFWVFDEVQLTGATLTTSAQLEGFRRRYLPEIECKTLWMSATLDPAWLRTVDFTPASTRRPHDLTEVDLIEGCHLWKAGKSLARMAIETRNIGKGSALVSYASSLARKAAQSTRCGTNTIIFLNTVARAQAVHDELTKIEFPGEVVLVHSRFRQSERSEQIKQLKDQRPLKGRIIITTQALEAGVDVTSATLITEIAPWSSLVQRFGRCNRYGECGESGAKVFWVDLSDEEARPYAADDFVQARNKLQQLSACGPSDLSEIVPSAPARGAVIRKRDLFDLFDTDPDISGFDVDVSPYVRDADDTDVRLFWRTVEGPGPRPDAEAPRREELCSAPIGGAKDLLKRSGVKAWRWDALIRKWQRTGADEVHPGMVLWVNATAGGYNPTKGFDATIKAAVEPVPILAPAGAERAIDNDEDATTKFCVSLVKHSLRVRNEAQRLAEIFTMRGFERETLLEAALWHDLGKAHDVFKARCKLAPGETPLAKTPSYNWREKSPRNRRNFRHELASALGLLASRQWDEKASLAAYLIAAHHGKVRMRLRALPNEPAAQGGKLYARGVWDGDALPATDLGGLVVPATALDLDIMQLGEGRCGPSWSARTQGLLRQYGPFRLAWFEALVRIADWRASAAEEEADHDDI